MNPHKVPEGHDHFYGFSRWSKEVMPYNYPNCFFWTDIDCLFPNPKTEDIHLIEIKINDAPVKPYQARLIDKLKELGVKTHFLRMYFNPKYFGDHENLGDPRLADKMILDDNEITYQELVTILNEWHGTELKETKHNLGEFM